MRDCKEERQYHIFRGHTVSAEASLTRFVALLVEFILERLERVDCVKLQILDAGLFQGLLTSHGGVSQLSS